MGGGGGGGGGGGKGCIRKALGAFHDLSLWDVMSKCVTQNLWTQLLAHSEVA